MPSSASSERRSVRAPDGVDGESARWTAHGSATSKAKRRDDGVGA
jgi:hypothetical protein